MRVLFSILRWAAFAALACGLLYACNSSPWALRQAAQEHAQQLAERTPHVIREADGCRVYEFEDNGNPHYFTRCKDGNVSTESDWTERQNKQLVQKSETIVTHEEN